jgi:cobalt/nickel transport system permease protein
MGIDEAKTRLISPQVAIVCGLIYTFSLAFKTTFDTSDTIVIIFLLIIRIKEFANILIRLLYIQGFVIFVALSIYLFHSNMTLATIIFIRFNLIALFMLSLFYNRHSEYLYYGFAALPLPDGFKSLIFLFTKASQLLIDDLGTIKETLLARGFVLKGNLLSYEIIANILGLLVIKSLHRAQNLQEVFVARNFNGRLYLLENSKINILDIILIIFIFINIAWSIYEL